MTIKNKFNSGSSTITIGTLSARLMGHIDTSKLITAPTKNKLSSHANWDGVLVWGSMAIGIKTYKATEENKILFNRVYVTNPRGKNPKYAQLKQGSMVNAEGYAVHPEKILSGYKVTDDEFVIISEEEKKSCMVESNKKMKIVKFVKANEIDPIFFNTAEYVSPNDGFNELFNVLRAGMVSRGVVAIAKSNQRGREQILVLRPYGTNGIIAHYMYFNNEINSFDKWVSTTINNKKIKIAGKLIDAMTESFDPAEYNDGYTCAIQSIINNKIHEKMNAMSALNTSFNDSIVSTKKPAKASLTTNAKAKAKAA